MNCLCPHLRERDTTDLTGLDIFLVHHTKSDLNRYVGVATSEFKQINLLATLQLGNAVVESPARVLGRTIGLVGARLQASFNT